MTIREKISKHLNKWRSFFRDKTRLDVGVIDAGNYPSGISVAAVAKIHEFGLGNAPQRSFLRSWVKENKKVFAVKLFDELKKDKQEGWAVVGQMAVEGIRVRMRTSIPPPLATATLARRRLRGSSSTTPLIDTGLLISAISYRVVRKK